MMFGLLISTWVGVGFMSLGNFVFNNTLFIIMGGVWAIGSLILMVYWGKAKKELISKDRSES